ncbi:MAG: hypothetical protein M1813_000024 [Trichoglossum hirsutum]|nr:MAG: hypothetical protein M1813_000024 [Trichoglossum hirsutum]
MPNKNQVMELNIELKQREPRPTKRINFKISRPSKIIVLQVGLRLGEIVTAQEATQTTPTSQSRRRSKKESPTKNIKTKSDRTSASASTRVTRASTRAAMAATVGSDRDTPITNIQKRRKSISETHEDSGSDATFTTTKRQQRRRKATRPAKGKGRAQVIYGNDDTNSTYVTTDALDPTTATYGTVVEPYFRRRANEGGSYYGFNDALVSPTPRINVSSNHGQSATFNNTLGAFDNPFDLTVDPQPSRSTSARIPTGPAGSMFSSSFDINTGMAAHSPSPSTVRLAQAGPAGSRYDFDPNTNAGRIFRGPNPAQSGPTGPSYDTLNTSPSHSRSPGPPRPIVFPAPAQARPANTFYDTLSPGNILNRPTGSSFHNGTPTPPRPQAQAQAGSARSFYDTLIPGNVLNRPSRSTPRPPNPTFPPSDQNFIDPALLDLGFPVTPAPNSMYDTPEKIKSWYTFGTNDVEATENPQVLGSEFDLGFDFDIPFLG